MAAVKVSLAFLITALLPLEEGLRVGLLVLATAAGAPFLPKLVEGAKGNVAFGVGLMVLLILLPTAKRLARHMPTTAPE